MARTIVKNSRVPLRSCVADLSWWGHIHVGVLSQVFFSWQSVKKYKYFRIENNLTGFQNLHDDWCFSLGGYKFSSLFHWGSETEDHGCVKADQNCARADANYHLGAYHVGFPTSRVGQWLWNGPTFLHSTAMEFLGRSAFFYIWLQNTHPTPANHFPWHMLKILQKSLFLSY